MKEIFLKTGSLSFFQTVWGDISLRQCIFGQKHFIGQLLITFQKMSFLFLFLLHFPLSLYHLACSPSAWIRIFNQTIPELVSHVFIGSEFQADCKVSYAFLLCNHVIRSGAQHQILGTKMTLVICLSQKYSFQTREKNVVHEWFLFHHWDEFL